jgi:class 3 adenylate cyclase
MEEVARAHSVRCVVSDAVVTAVGSFDRMREIGDKTVKGISTSIRVYEYQPRVDAA